VPVLATDAADATFTTATVEATPPTMQVPTTQTPPTTTSPLPDDVFPGDATCGFGLAVATDAFLAMALALARAGGVFANTRRSAVVSVCGKTSVSRRAPRRATCR
jgi:hypothetical protein